MCYNVTTTVPFVEFWRYNMNTCYNKSDYCNSNKRIIEAYLNISQIGVANTKKHVDVLLILRMLISFFCSEKAVALYRVCGTVLSLVGMIGIIGGIETGKMGLFSGLFFGAFIVFVEYLCLRPRRQRD